MAEAPFPLYLITDRRLAKSGIVAACDEVLAAARPYRIGIAVQLREKDLSARELYMLAREMRAVCTKHGAMLLVNDRIDVALAAGADGVHLPADSIDPAEARRLLGRFRLIGVSTHTVDEVRAAAKSGADFAVFGPVYDPISKSAYGPATGIEGLRRACAAAEVPVYALGGITAERVADTCSAGAAGVAVIGSVFGAESPAAAIRSILSSISNAEPER